MSLQVFLQIDILAKLKHLTVIVRISVPGEHRPGKQYLVLSLPPSPYGILPLSECATQNSHILTLYFQSLVLEQE